MTTLPASTQPLTRPLLSRYSGRVVTAEASYCKDTLALEDGRWLYLLRDVCIYPNVLCHHIWLDLPMHARRRLVYDQRFTFRASVERYTRSNGSEDFSLGFISFVAG